MASRDEVEATIFNIHRLQWHPDGQGLVVSVFREKSLILVPRRFSTRSCRLENGVFKNQFGAWSEQLPGNGQGMGAKQRLLERRFITLQIQHLRQSQCAIGLIGS